tara:strand:+ start:54 stop:779 length:726 start_codon:yes stop_codon:yes gene_type:complete
MAFKMAPKSPLLMKAMGHASPAKQSVQGTNQTVEAVGKPEGPALTALQQAQQEANAAQMNNKVAQIKRNTAGTNKASGKLEKKTARDNSKAERRAEKTKRLEQKIERRKARRSPAKQTAKQKANLPKEIVNAIAAKSPAKEIDKAGQRIIRQGEKAKAAYKAGDAKKGDRHKVRAKRMNGRYNAKMLKNNLKGGRNEVSKFEKNIEIQEKFDAKIEKAKGNTKKIARLTKRANSKMDRSAN